MGKINIYISQYVLKKLPSEAKRARSALSLYCLILHSETHALAKLIIDIDIYTQYNSEFNSASVQLT